MPDPRASDSTIVFQRLRLAGDVITDSLAFLREHFADIGRGLLYIAGPVVLLGTVFSAIAQQNMLGSTDWLDPNADPFAVFDLFGPAYFLSVLVLMLGTFLITAVGYAYVLLYMDDPGQVITVPVLWDEVKAILLPVLTTNLGLGLIIMLAALINIIPCLGTLAWIGGLVYFFPAISLTLTARLVDEDNLFAAFRRSRDLVKGYWGQTFGVVIMAYLVYLVVSLVFSIPAMLLGGTAGFLGAMNGETLPTSAIIIGSLFAVFAYAVLVLLPIAFTMQYYNLVERHEGPDLDDRIDAISAGGAGVAEPLDFNEPASGTAPAAEDVDRWRRPPAQPDSDEVDGGDASDFR